MAKAKARKTSLPKLIEKYYADLAEFTRQNVLFEMGTRQAFHRLMADAGKDYFSPPVGPGSGVWNSPHALV